MEYLIEANTGAGWYIVGSERGCTQEWAERTARNYRRLFPDLRLRVSWHSETELSYVEIGTGAERTGAA